MILIDMLCVHERDARASRGNLASYEEGYVSIDIVFYGANGKPLHKGAIRDIDGLIYDIYSQKFETIKSCKLPIKKTSWKEESDFILAYGNIPLRDNTLIKNFIRNNERLKKLKTDKFINKIESFKFKMKDVRTKKDILMNASDFQQRVKSSYLQSDIIEINPSTFNTTREQIIEGTYQYLHKKYNQTNSWD
ncbi:hypothetical protein [Flavobacterium sp. ACN2]|uniref:hypothetical protein n=1 Tax=Flavobacterium sp. ACN2 TaxID=1975676 RepID=UPI00114329D9|nr:hypothetical protein [Flavobacterium sp. ACN2]